MITYEELKKETNDFATQDFWYWFLTYDRMDNDTKVHILDWFTSDMVDDGSIVKYLKYLGVVKS